MIAMHAGGRCSVRGTCVTERTAQAHRTPRKDQVHGGAVLMWRRAASLR